MIERISVKNYAIIENIEIEFNSGFSVFTGETGAGKSIIVDAMGLVLGERADSTIVRTGTDKAVIEAEFSINDKQTIQKLRSLNMDFGDSNDTTDNSLYCKALSLIIRREVSANGKSRAFINGYQQTIGQLSKVGEWLVDMHGQHDHQILLNQKVHLEILDSYGNIAPQKSQVEKLYIQLIENIKLKQVLEQDEKKLEEERIFWETAIEDVNKASLLSNEENELNDQFKLMENAEAINQSLAGAYDKLYSDEISVSSRLNFVINSLDSIRGIDPRYAELYTILEDASAKVDESVNLLSNYKDEIEYDEKTLDEISGRLELIKDLKRKYNKNTVAEIIAYAEECANKLAIFENRAVELENITKAIDEIKIQLIDTALKLSKNRQEIAKSMAKKIKIELGFLGMQNAQFIVDIKYVKDDNSPIAINNKPIKIDKSGIDRVEFLISSNAGEEPRPLQKIASGGEISRVMLALKSILASNDAIGALVFDEIDVGIGGITANNVAQKMAELATKRQVIAITHLPQIASQAKTHFYVSKSTDNERTFAKVKMLNKDTRIAEIARMLGGNSEASLIHAKEMLNN